jgi:DNA-binding SARP family transcriptional activator
VEFRILGSLEVAEEGRTVRVARGKQGALLTILLLHANETVSRDRLIEELWAGEPPESARTALHYHVSRLRKALADGSSQPLLVTHGSGYEIRIEPDQLDLGRFERRVDEARAAREAGDPATASALLREALDLWRGPPLADVAYEPFAQTAIGRLEELRLSALEDWVGAELAVGHHDRLIGTLEELVSNHPLRERLRGQLILALYRSGRQSEALEQYRQTRSVLVDELGIEPSAQLQQLERAILTQDPGLELSPAEKTTTTAAEVQAEPDPAHAARRRRRWLLPAVAIVLLAAIGATLAVLLTATGSGSARSTPSSASGIPANSVVAIDPGDNSVANVVRVGLEPGALAMDGGLVWVANMGDRTVSEIDARSRKIVRTIGVGVLPDVLAAQGGVAWVASREGRPVMIDGRTGRTRPWSVKGIHVDPGTIVGGTIAFGHDSLWIGLANTLTVWRVDPVAMRVVATIRGIDARTIVPTSSAVWVLDGGGRITRIDPQINAVAASIPFGIHESTAGLAAGDGTVWALDYEGQRLLRIDAGKSRITGDFPLDQGLGDAVAVGGRAVWVTQRVRGTILRIDPETGRVTARIPLGHLIQLGSIGYGRDRLWVGLGVPIQS